MKTDKTTNTLTSILRSADADSFQSYLDHNKESLAPDNRPFSTYIRSLLREKGIRQQNVFIAADISEGYGYKLISEEKHTRQRDIILRLCLAGKLTLDETQRALKLYGMSPLYARIPRDAALIIAFNTGTHEISDVDAFLTKHGFEPLLPCTPAE